MNKLKIVIIGGVAAGASAAGKAARTDKNVQVVMIEKGPYISYANCGLPYYISRDVEDRGKLVVRRPQQFREKYGVEVFVNTEALSINRAARSVRVRDTARGEIREIEYDKLILAMGAYTFMPPVPGLKAPNVFQLRTIPDIDAIDDFITNHRPSRAVVLGGGYIGIEAAEVLMKRGIKTALFEMLPQVLPPLDPDMAKLMEEKMTSSGLDLFLGSPVERIETDSPGYAREVIAGDGRRASADLVIASLGVRPDMKLAVEAGLEKGKFGISVDDYMRTSDPDIYAAGDMVETVHLVTGKPTWAPLAGPANQQGKVAGCNAAGGNMRFRGVLRSSIVQFDGMAASKTGLSEKEAVEEGLDFFAVRIKASSHAGYYPGSKPLYVKGIFKRATGRLLGAQAVGEEGADKRIDILAACITAKMTAGDLENLDLAYSPQVSNSLDAINILGSVAQTKMEE